MNPKRLLICLFLGLFFGAGCAYGTMTSPMVPEFAKTTQWLLTTVYNRVLIGLFIGLVDKVQLVKKKKLFNAALRGGILGALVTLGISFYGGAIIYIIAGIIYGAITDVVGTKFS